MTELKPRLKTLVQHIFLLFVVYAVCRLFFYVFNYAAFASVSVGEVIALFFYGLRFDAFSICALSSVYVLLYSLPFRFVQTKVYGIILDVFYILPNAIGILLNFVDFAYFPFNHNRSNYNVVSLAFNGESDMTKLLPEFFAQFWFIVLLFVVTMFFFVKFYWRIKKQSQGQTVQPNAKSILVALLAFILLNGLTVLGIRGGLQRAPIVILDAAAYTEPNNIPLVVNTPFFVLKTAELAALDTVPLVPQALADRLVNPIHTPSAQLGDFKPLNVCVLILESFSKEFTKLGKRKSYTPFLDSLMDVSILFTNGIANGKTSLEGIPSLVASLPSYMANPYINSMYSNNNIQSLANLLKQEKYSTAFYHGGTNGTMNFNVFAKAAGYEVYFGRSEYNNDDDFDGQWGIWDEPFLQKTIEKIREQNKPAFSTIFTLSSHNPYRVPEKYQNKFPKGNQDIIQTIGYADYALRKFFMAAQKEAWFKNTLFVISPDHTAASEDNFYKHQLGQFTIPILLYQHGIQPRVVEKTVQQIDVMPTVLSYVNYPRKYYSLGHNMFDTISYPCLYYLNPTYYCVNENVFYAMKDYTFNAKYYFNHDSGLINPKPIEQADRACENYCKALIQRYNRDMINNRLQADK